MVWTVHPSTGLLVYINQRQQIILNCMSAIMISISLRLHLSKSYNYFATFILLQKGEIKPKFNPVHGQKEMY